MEREFSFVEEDLVALDWSKDCVNERQWLSSIVLRLLTLERFLIACPETKTKAVTMTNRRKR